MPTPDVARVNQDSFLALFRYVQKKIYTTAEGHGFHECKGNKLYVPTTLALLMSEVVEALEAHRMGRMKEFGPELADIVIHTMDLAESLKIDLALEIVMKADFNVDRPFKHGNKLY